VPAMIAGGAISGSGTRWRRPLLLVWVCGVCRISVWSYLFLVVYPGIAITHLRSFAEHQADDQSLLRTNVVEAHPLLALLS